MNRRLDQAARWLPFIAMIIGAVGAVITSH